MAQINLRKFPRNSRINLQMGYVQDQEIKLNRTTSGKQMEVKREHSKAFKILRKNYFQPNLTWQNSLTLRVEKLCFQLCKISKQFCKHFLRKLLEGLLHQMREQNKKDEDLGS